MGTLILTSLLEDLGDKELGLSEVVLLERERGCYEFCKDMVASMVASRSNTFQYLEVLTSSMEGLCCCLGKLMGCP